MSKPGEPIATVVAALEELKSQIGIATVRELIAVFEANSAQQVREIQSAILAGERRKAQTEAHSLKSSSAALGAVELSESCRVLEKSAGSSDDECRALGEEIARLRALAIASMHGWDKSQGA